jgi:hypothetical protein
MKAVIFLSSSPTYKYDGLAVRKVRGWNCNGDWGWNWGWEGRGREKWFVTEGKGGETHLVVRQSV